MTAAIGVCVAFVVWFVLMAAINTMLVIDLIKHEEKK